MNRTVVVSVLAIALSMLAAPADATPSLPRSAADPIPATSISSALRKCGSSAYGLAFYIDYALVGVDSPDGSKAGSEVFSRLKAEEIEAIRIACDLVRDPVTGNGALRSAIYVITKAGVDKSYREFQSIVLGLPARQEAYRAARGVYAPTADQLTMFDGQPHVSATFAVTATGWFADVPFDGAPRSCRIAGGSTPPPPNDVLSGEMRCADVPASHGEQTNLPERAAPVIQIRTP